MNLRSSSLAAVLAISLLSGCGDSNDASTPSNVASDSALHGAARGFNVLLVTVDTLRADRLGAYGYSAAETPTLDRLAREGVLVERALAPCPVTLPSHTSLMTGLNPVEHDVRDNGIFVADDSLTTLAEVLQSEGYATAAFVSAHVLDARYGLDQGFDAYQGALGEESGGTSTRIERRAESTVRQALAWLRSAPPEPWFLWVHLFDPHAPYSPPEPEKSRHAHPYDGEIAYTDRQLGVLLDGLHREGPDTMVVVTSDHGEGLGEHREATHGLFIYDSTLRVPLILHGAPLGSGKRVAGQVSLIDVAPTLLDVLGLEGFEETSGKSFLPALSMDRPEVWHDTYLETQLSYWTYGLAALEGVSTRTDKWIEAPRPELYAWPEDPQELRDLASSAAERAIELGARMEKLRGGRDSMASVPDIVMGSEEQEMLRRLGYVTGDAEFTGADPKDMVEVFEKQTQAALLVEQEKFREALALLDDIVERLPKSGNALALRGEALRRLGRTDDAIESFVASIQVRPDNPGVAFVLGGLYEELKQPAKALESYDLAIATDPAWPSPYLSASRVWYQRQDFDRARVYLQRALEAVPKGHRKRDLIQKRLGVLKGE